MTAEQLKNSILQEAISGRLVPQDPNDEPAANLSSVPEDEIPFEIPSSWRWVFLKDCAKIIGGYAFPSASIKGDKGIRVIRISDISEKGFVNKSVVRYNGNDNLEKFKVLPQDILMAMTGGTVGKSLFVKEMDEEMLLNQRVAIIRNNGQYAPYLDMAVKSPHIKSFINDKKNSTNDNISMGDINNFLVPLPPLAEQKRIVAKLEELLPIVEQYGKAQKELDELNTALPARLRQSILQEAIQGKLTEHDLEDNWAKVYCEKLPKLKYKSSPEWPQEYPFELPENWEWCRIGDICELMNGYAFKSTQYKETGVRVIRITNVQDGYIVDNNPKFYPQIPDIGRYALKEGDLLMSLTGNVGRVGILPQSMLPAALNQRVACLRLKDERLKPFLFGYLRCPIFRERCEDSGHGMAQLNISTEWVKQEYIPLPPLAEQKRIVAKIEELFEQIDKISK